MSRESDEVGERQFWEQFDHYEPDYPQTYISPDFTESEWYIEHSE